jgi:molybdate transport system ATP-binding protein
VTTSSGQDTEPELMLKQAAPAPLHLDVVTRIDEFTLQVRLDAPPGLVLAVVGPNGAGKTTLLRTIAGLSPVTDGTVRLGDEVLDDAATDTFVPVEERPVSVVFQDYRLFPHLSVADNVAFPLRSRGAKRAVAAAGAQAWLERFGLVTLAHRRPHQLSGGQAQRVALARALAASPRVLLLDEPLAALDAQTRLDVRGELRHHLSEFPGVCLLVTHDPLEALILADLLLVLEDGRATQLGAPADVARRPATPYVASLVGLNLYRGSISSEDTVTLDNGVEVAAPGHGLSGAVLVTFRPSAVAVYLDQPLHGSPRNNWPGVITSVELLADRVRLQVDGPISAYVDVTPAAVADLRLSHGVEVWVAVKSTDIDVYPAPDGMHPPRAAVAPA